MVFSGKIIAILLASVLTLGGGLAYVANQRAQQEAAQQPEPQPLVSEEAQSGTPDGTSDETPVEQQTAAVDSAEPQPVPQGAAEPAQPEPAQSEQPAAEETATQDTPAQDTTAQDTRAPEAGEAASEPEFDVVRVDENGSVVIAGRAEPGAEVDIVVGNQVVTTIEADERGEFATVLDEPLDVGTSALRLRATAPGGETADSGQEVTVFIEEPGAAPLVVAQDAQGPTEVLQEAEPVVAATSNAPAASEPEAVVTAGDDAEPVLIRSVDVRPPAGAGADNEVVVAGTAPAGAALRVYLQDLQVGEAIASDTGDWSVSFSQEMSPGRYVIRADQIDPQSGNVLARAQTRFRRAAILAEGAPAAAISQPTQAEGQQPALTENATETAREQQASAGDASGTRQQPGAGKDDEEADVSVVRGDSLWRISRNAYGRGIHYTVIFEANRSQITDPDLIFPGQVFTIPEFEEESAG